MTDPARIQRIAAAVRACAVSWEPGARLVGNVTADEIRELAIAASQAVAPVEPVVWVEGAPKDGCDAQVGPLMLSVWSRRDGWAWEVLIGDERIASYRTAEEWSTDRDAAKTAAIAAARAWRDSIRL